MIQSDLICLEFSPAPPRSKGWITSSKACIYNGGLAYIASLCLRTEKFDGDVAEGSVGKVAGDVGEAAARKMRFAILELKMDFGLVADGVDDIGGTKGNVNVVVVVLMKQRVFVWRDFDVIHADIFVFDFQVMVRFAGHIAVRQRHRLLCARWQNEQEKRGAKDQFH